MTNEKRCQLIWVLVHTLCETSKLILHWHRQLNNGYFKWPMAKRQSAKKAIVQYTRYTVAAINRCALCTLLHRHSPELNTGYFYWIMTDKSRAKWESAKNPFTFLDVLFCTHNSKRLEIFSTSWRRTATKQRLLLMTDQQGETTKYSKCKEAIFYSFRCCSICC